jgi:hypothetical protein
MAKFNKGDKVRFNDKSNTAWFGVEGVVEREGSRISNYGLRLTVAPTGWAAGSYKVGDTAHISEDYLELVSAAGELAVGDKIRTNNNCFGLDWVGIEGVITATNYIGESVQINITANPPQGYDVGDWISLPPRKFDVVEPVDTLPREVKVSEVRVGDTVKVTYPEKVSEIYGVKQTMVRVREGKVEKTNGACLSTEEGELINGYFDGLKEAVYTLLERPVKPVRAAATEPVGAQFKAKDPYGNSGRLLTKVAENKWTDVFMETGSVYSASDREAQITFDGRAGEWLKV